MPSVRVGKGFVGGDGSGRPILGVFGGSFDPPHLGHAMLPAYLLARGLADEVWVAPVADHAFGKTMRAFEDRLLLTRVAMSRLGPRVVVTDLEAKLAHAHGGASRSLRLLEAVAAQRPDAQVRLVIGSDIIADGQTHNWHRWETIEREFPPIVVPRAGVDPQVACALPEISSTAVRGWLTAYLRDGDSMASTQLDGALPAGVRPLLEAMGQPAGPPVWVVGQGHVATHAVPWLAAQRIGVRSISGRGLVDGSVDLSEAPPPSAIWILVHDSATQAVARKLASLGLGTHIPVLHGAGAIPAKDPTALGCLSDAGHPVGSLHPICSLRRELPWPSPLPHAGFGLEGDPAARSVAQKWVGAQPCLDLDGLDGQQRVAYHAACALAANHLAVLYDEAGSVLRGQGHAASDVESALSQLLHSALNNLTALGIPQGITGPVSRGDTETVAAHVRALPHPTSELYAVLSQRLANVVTRTRKDPSSA